MVEEARLESSYTSKAYQGFESPSLRKRPGGRLGCKHSFATFFIFGVDKFIRSGLKIKVRSNGGKDGRHAVTRSRAGSAEEWKRGEMLYGSTAFLCLQRGKVVRISYGVCIEREAVKGLASFLSSENRIFGNDF